VPKWGAFLRLQVPLYKRVGISQVEVYERVGKSAILRKKILTDVPDMVVSFYLLATCTS